MDERTKEIIRRKFSNGSTIEIEIERNGIKGSLILAGDEYYPPENRNRDKRSIEYRTNEDIENDEILNFLESKKYLFKPVTIEELIAILDDLEKNGFRVDIEK